MKRAVLAAFAAACIATTSFAQSTPKAVVSLYQAAPGQQEALLRFLADQDRAAAAAGVAPSQIYVHTMGDSWDFAIINPVTTDAQDDAIDAAAARMGMPTGPRAALEFRKLIMTHSDTMANGPQTAAQILAGLGPKK